MTLKTYLAILENGFQFGNMATECESLMMSLHNVMKASISSSEIPETIVKLTRSPRIQAHSILLGGSELGKEGGS